MTCSSSVPCPRRQPLSRPRRRKSRSSRLPPGTGCLPAAQRGAGPASGIPRSLRASVSPVGPGSGADRSARPCSHPPVLGISPCSPGAVGRTSSDQLVLRRTRPMPIYPGRGCQAAAGRDSVAQRAGKRRKDDYPQTSGTQISASARAVAQRAPETLTLVRHRTQPTAETIVRLTVTAVFAYLISLTVPGTSHSIGYALHLSSGTSFGRSGRAGGADGAGAHGGVRCMRVGRGDLRGDHEVALHLRLICASWRDRRT